MLRTHDERLILPAIFLACIGCLQPGIDPVFLTLLSSAHEVAPEAHGWVVTLTQSGMALGAIIAWRWGHLLPRAIFAGAACLAIATALLTAQVADLPTLLALRAGYGATMGLVYTQAVSSAARNRPHGAYGAVFLCQLILATLIALGLPAIAQTFGPQAALRTLALPPLLALLLVLTRESSLGTARSEIAPRMEHGTSGASMSAWATAGASLLFICATMMVWTFSGAMAVKAGISEETIGQAVAIGSLAGAATALLVMRERLVVPPPLTGVLAGISLLAPIAAAQTAVALAFVIAIVLLNIGSTAIIVRTSGLASAASRDGLFRRFVACTHPLGMILGPLTGSLASAFFGQQGLLMAAITAIASGCILLLFAQRHTLFASRWAADEESLDEYLTNVQH